MEVKIKNYEIIESLLLRIEGVTVISGKSHNGKSAIFRAIESLCLGQRGEKFVRNGANVCSVELFDGRNSFEWGRKGDTYFRVGDRTFTKTLGFPPEDYTKILGIKRIEINKDLSLSPNFAGQFDPLFILGLSPSETAAALSFLFSGEKFPDLLKTIAKQIKDDKGTIVFDEGRIEQLEKDLIELKAKVSAIEPISPLFELRKKIPIWVSGFKTVESDLAELDRLEKGKVTAWNELQSVVNANQLLSGSVNESLLEDVERINADLGTLDAFHESVTYAGSELQKVKDSLAHLSVVDELIVVGLEKCIRDCAEYDKIQAELASTQSQIVECKSVLEILAPVSSSLPRELEVLESLCVSFDSFIKEREAEAQKIADNARALSVVMSEIPKVTQQLTHCPSCSSELNDATKQYLLEHLA